MSKSCFYRLESGNLIFESSPIVDPSKQLNLKFLPSGSFSVIDRNDDLYQVTNEVIEESYYYGIVAYINLEFSKYVAIIDKIEVISYQPRIYRVLDVSFVKIYSRPIALSLNEEEFEEVTLREIQKQLANHNTYFSHDFEIVRNLQMTKQTTSINVDEEFRYYWNANLLRPMIREPVDLEAFIVPLISGYVGSSIFTLNGISVELILISRISAYNCGTRYWTRGLDDNANPAILVETEVILSSSRKSTSYVMIRGSVPLMWSSNISIYPFQETINLGLSKNPSSLKNMETHCNSLILKYGGVVNIVDLIDRSNEQSRALSTNLQDCLDELNSENILYFNYNMRSPDVYKCIQDMVTKDLKIHEYFMAIANSNAEGARVIKKQNGIFRLNDIDCVDDTALVMGWIFEIAISAMIKEFNIENESQFQKMIIQPFRSMWIKMSDKISEHYTGGNASFRYSKEYSSNFLWSRLKSAKREIARYYMGRYQDFAKQDSLDLLMGDHCGEPQSIKSRVKLRNQIIFMDYSYSSTASVILLLKRFTAPRKVEYIPEVILASIWSLLCFVLILIFRYDYCIFMRQPKKLFSANELPDISRGQPKGVAVLLEKYRQRSSPELVRMVRRGRDNMERPPVHVAVAFN